MEKIEITTRFSKKGKLIPLDFSLDHEKVEILSVGRQWETEDGRHILVMDFQKNTHHLFFDVVDLSWYLIKDMQRPPGKV